MAFDMGFNARATAGFVTDGAEGVPMLGEAYPHTYTNGNGDSINAGWTTAISGTENRQSGNDPRIAGVNYAANFIAVRTFQIDLDSGSNPGAGDYTVDLAMGHPDVADTQVFQLLDTASVLIDGTNGGSGFATLAANYRDATLTNVAATTSWTGATASKTFATTVANMNIGTAGVADYSTLAHLRLTLVAGGPTAPPSPLAESVAVAMAESGRGVSLMVSDGKR